MTNDLNNRIWNSKNPYQGTDKKVLTVCSAGLLRSPTAARILSVEPFKFNTRSCGSSRSFALIPVDPVLLSWADVVLFMTPENRQETIDQFGDELFRDKSHTFHFPDNFGYMDAELIDIMVPEFKNYFQIK